ncbi:hypothetical protein FRX31_030734 [Thalictrum thalictroides]|uniref:Uncharacterized protein n=1 Tax=Thalictrum thalictroides TaxID=46969 RepID=A0A7J6V667_THATH|nr:hypothetical protein FRX31_030734 [Thalictrum thalictroides]
MMVAVSGGMKQQRNQIIDADVILHRDGCFGVREIKERCMEKCGMHFRDATCTVIMKVCYCHSLYFTHSQIRENSGTNLRRNPRNGQENLE